MLVGNPPRRVMWSSCTASPNEPWVTQQARNLSWKLLDESIQLKGLIHDRDKKFARKADTVLRSEGASDIDSSDGAQVKRPRRALDWKLPP